MISLATTTILPEAVYTSRLTYENDELKKLRIMLLLTICHWNQLKSIPYFLKIETQFQERLYSFQATLGMAHIIGTTQRRLETVLDDFKRARKYWKELNSEGFPVANKLVNCVIQSRYVDDPAYWHPALVDAFPNVVQKYDGKMTVVINDHSQKLENIVQKMAVQQRKMQQHLLEINAIYNRARDMGGEDILNNPLYKTCSLSIFVQRVRAIVSMYESELATKQSLASPKGFRCIRHREESLTLLSIWLNQPSLEDKDLVEFQDMCAFEMS